MTINYGLFWKHKILSKHFAVRPAEKLNKMMMSRFTPSAHNAAALCNDQSSTRSASQKWNRGQKNCKTHILLHPTTSRNVRWMEEMSFHHCCCHSRISASTSLWIIADKILGSPTADPPPPQSLPLPPVPVTSHHSKITGGLHAWRAHTFLISYLSLLGVILWDHRADLSTSAVQVSTLESLSM